MIRAMLEAEGLEPRCCPSVAPAGIVGPYVGHNWYQRHLDHDVCDLARVELTLTETPPTDLVDGATLRDRLGTFADWLAGERQDELDDATAAQQAGVLDLMAGHVAAAAHRNTEYQ